MTMYPSTKLSLKLAHRVLRRLLVRINYLEVIRGIRILVTGDDLRGHPVRGPNKRVPPSHRTVQLSTHTKVHCTQNTVHSAAVQCRAVHVMLLTARIQSGPSGAF